MLRTIQCLEVALPSTVIWRPPASRPSAGNGYVVDRRVCIVSSSSRKAVVILKGLLPLYKGVSPLYLKRPSLHIIVFSWNRTLPFISIAYAYVQLARIQPQDGSYQADAVAQSQSPYFSLYCCLELAALCADFVHIVIPIIQHYVYVSFAPPCLMRNQAQSSCSGREVQAALPVPIFRPIRYRISNRYDFLYTVVVSISTNFCSGERGVPTICRFCCAA